MLSCRVSKFIYLLHDETGQDLIEYGLIAALIALGAILSMNTLSSKLSAAFIYIGTKVTQVV